MSSDNPSGTGAHSGADSRARAIRLGVMLANLTEARSLVADQRSRPGRDRTGADGELLAALESYAAELEKARRPIPYALRDELALRRRLSRLPGGA